VTYGLYRKSTGSTIALADEERSPLLGRRSTATVGDLVNEIANAVAAFPVFEYNRLTNGECLITYAHARPCELSFLSKYSIFEL